MAPDNTLYYGDNLDILRQHIRDESVDLIYLDPPFNSNRNYNLLFRESSGATSAAQLEAFEDTWHWGDAARDAYDAVMRGPRQDVVRMLGAMVEGLGHNDVTAYLSMMAVRLIELHRVLKPTGSIYLHCDPTASHYLKILMDAIFGPSNFRNEVIWKRTTTVKGNFGQGSKLWGQATDSILFYTKTGNYVFNQLFRPYSSDYVDGAYRLVEEGTGRRYRLVSMIGPGGASKGNPQYEVMGVTRYWRYSRKTMQDLIDKGLVVQTKPRAVPHRKYYLDEGKGVPVQSLWDDIGNLQASDSERLGYPTQKPVALLERIIAASSNEGDVVLDPFCGCGTAVHAAQKLGRQWLGIDVTYLAIGLIRRRMQDAFPGIPIREIGAPRDLTGAQALAEKDKYQFQWWALDRLGAQPVGGAKKNGADRGIDGVIPFMATHRRDYRRIIVSVKGGGNVSVAMVRDLVGVLQREKEPMGILLSLENPTGPMLTEAAAAGTYHSELWQESYPAVQIVTVADLLAGRRPKMPRTVSPFAQAPVEQERAAQLGMPMVE